MSGNFNDICLNFLFSTSEEMPSTAPTMFGITPVAINLDQTIRTTGADGNVSRHADILCRKDSQHKFHCISSFVVSESAPGPKAMKVLDTRPIPTDPSPDDVLTLIFMVDTRVCRQVNTTSKRYLFAKRTQASSESI